jgi:hypothetical protein
LTAFGGNKLKAVEKASALAASWAMTTALR